jgi:hypothetical protein
MVLTIQVTAYVSSVAFGAATENFEVTLSDQSTAFITWTFPHLIVNNLMPGEQIEMASL